MTSILHSVYTMPFPERLTSLRKARGLTQEGLADLVGLTKLQIYRYERCDAQPSLEVIKKLAVALSVTIDALVFDEAERQPDRELLHLFEGVSRLDDSEKALIKELIESIMLKHDAKRWIQQTPDPTKKAS